MKWEGDDVFRIDGVLSVAKPCRIPVDSLREAFLWRNDPNSLEYAFTREIYLNMERLHLIDSLDGETRGRNLGKNHHLVLYSRSLSVLRDLTQKQGATTLDGFIVNGKKMFLFTPEFFKFKKMK